jgi:hypothetical protein
MARKSVNFSNQQVTYLIYNELNQGYKIYNESQNPQKTTSFRVEAQHARPSRGAAVGWMEGPGG